MSADRKVPADSLHIGDRILIGFDSVATTITRIETDRDGWLIFRFGVSGSLRTTPGTMIRLVRPGSYRPSA